MREMRLIDFLSKSGISVIVPVGLDPAKTLSKIYVRIQDYDQGGTVEKGCDEAWEKNGERK